MKYRPIGKKYSDLPGDRRRVLIRTVRTAEDVYLPRGAVYLPVSWGHDADLGRTVERIDFNGMAYRIIVA